MNAPVVVDIAGAVMGGAARYADELRRYLDRSARSDIRLVGERRRLTPGWLAAREPLAAGAARKVALNNVSFTGPGGSRVALLRNALHFLTDTEARDIDPGLLRSVRRESAVVKAAARRAELLVVPSSAMAERVAAASPSASRRLVVRHHPVSAAPATSTRTDQAILCPVLLAPYKQMGERLLALARTLDRCGSDVALRITAVPAEFPSELGEHQRVRALGRLDAEQLRGQWHACRAVYFPTSIESFGYPLAEARVMGRPVIALDTAQNREIAGRALCGFDGADDDSLQTAVTRALSVDIDPDPAPFDPDAYFDWLLGRRR